MRKLWIALPLALAGCTTANGSASNSASAKAQTEMAKVLVSDQQEVQIGDQVYAGLVQKGTRFISDPAVTGYVTQISNKLFALANRERSGVQWRVLVIDDPATVNAFSTPGGRLYVYSGLIKAVTDDAQMAGVMGHEIGHEVARHVARQLIQTNGLQAVTNLALGKNPGLLGQLASTAASQGTLLAFSRNDETEADEYGARYAAEAGYDPNGLVAFFRTLQTTEGKVPAMAKYLSDHPLTTDRITHLQRYIAANHLRGAAGGTAALAQAKAQLGGTLTAATPTSNPRPTAQPASATPPPKGPSHH